jgi:Carboxypeptidase regulatory-like domain
MKRILIFVALLGIAVLFAVRLNAQTTNKGGTTLAGVVVGADNKPVAHAGVTCESSGGLHPRAVHTDAKGRFTITGLRQDNYDLRASAGGAYSDWERNIPVKKGHTKEVTLRLLNGNTALVGTPPATPVKKTP